MSAGPWRRRALQGAVLWAGLASAACGKRGDPLPPLPTTPQAISALRVAQRGDQVEITLITPRATASGARLGLLEVELLIADASGDFFKVARKSREKAAPGETLRVERPLPPPKTALRLAARAIHRGDKSAFTPVVPLRVEPPVPPPTGLAARQDLGGVTLKWDAPQPMPHLVVPPPPPSPSPSPLLPSFLRPRPSPSPSPGSPVSPPGAAPSGPPPAGGPSAAPSSPSPAAPGFLGGPPPSPAPPPVAPPSPAPVRPPPAETSASPAAPPASTSPTASPGPSPSPPAPGPGGFFVYRRSRLGGYTRPLSLFLTTPVFVDKTVTPPEEVCYVVRTVISTEPVIESAPSNEECLATRDVTPPAPPVGLAALPGPGGIQISWSPSPEDDLASYRLYRSAGEAPAAMLAQVPRGQTAYKDASAEPGVAYHYTLTAVDTSGNESPPSSPASGRRP